MQTIIVAALIVVGYVVTGLSYGWAASVGGAMVKLGVAMMVGGISQMMAPQPKGLRSRDNAENQASYNFNGPVNTEAQGVGLPIADPDAHARRADELGEHSWPQVASSSTC